MRYVSLFSGVEAATLAWSPLGWEPMAFAEIDPFPCAVLAFRFPDVPNLGDVSKVDWKEFERGRGRPDVVVGGSPCQSFSIAGKREGLEGASGLMWEFVRACDQLRPRWVVWENVPGALSSSGGEDFRCLLQALDELGYCSAWRVLDAQFFGVAQRRRRLFLVGSLGSGRSAEVLLEPEGLRGVHQSSREKRAELAARSGVGSQKAGGVYGIAGNVIGRKPGNGGNGTGYCDPDEDGFYTLTATDRFAVVVTGGESPCDPTQSACGGRPGGGKGPLVQEEVSGTLATGNDQVVFCMADAASNTAIDEGVAGTLKANNGRNQPVAVFHGGIARKLTPEECERLQGMPDGWTRVPYRGKPADECPDGPRYRAIGNSFAVPVVRWIGERMQAYEDGAL